MTHPITPPPELLKLWEDDWFDGRENVDVLLLQAFQAGADRELEACCEWVQTTLELPGCANQLRSARRPKPPSLKKQACDALDAYVYGNPDHGNKQDTYNTIRRALEALPDD